MSSWLIWNAFTSAAKALTVSQVMLYLPLTLSALSPPAFLLLSLLQTLHSLIHSTLHVVLPALSPSLPFLQLPVHPVILLLSFNLFSNPPRYLVTLAAIWGKALRLWTPVFVGMEGLASLLVIQSTGRKGRDLSENNEGWQIMFLLGAGAAHVVSALWIVTTYPAIATTPLSSTLFGVASTVLVFLTLIGFAQRRTNVIESAGMFLYFAYNVWLCSEEYEDGGYGSEAYYAQWFYNTSRGAAVYAPLLSNILPHLSKLLSFIQHTLPKSLLVSLIYRLLVLQLASNILPSIGADTWESEDGTTEIWEGRPSSTITKILLAYRQTIFVTTYSHLLLLDHSSQVWWQWANLFFTLAMWAIELLLTNEEDDITGSGVGKLWKTE
ncbi:hypothetical protein FRC03_007140 [Tulasnella sp. 419]|nr:hypothetical protein FRC02_009841 [Tulasnella sp. 418]KAG8960027.1 hypothetical protein FRC03_007140 [Tulasnella sp. 419]